MVLSFGTFGQNFCPASTEPCAVFRLGFLSPRAGSISCCCEYLCVCLAICDKDLLSLIDLHTGAVPKGM